MHFHMQAADTLLGRTVQLLIKKNSQSQGSKLAMQTQSRRPEDGRGREVIQVSWIFPQSHL